MQELVELIGSINFSRLKSSGLWAVIFEEGSMLEQLCLAIEDGRVATDEDAIALLYGGERGGSKFFNLRERLKERLLNVVFLLEFKSASLSNRQKAYQECSRKWAAAILLNSKNVKRVSMGVFEDVLKQAIYYEFTDLALNALSYLKVYYGAIYGDAGRYAIYREMYRKYQEIWLLENEAEDSYTHLVSHFVNSKSSKTALSDTAKEYFDRLRPAMAQSDSFRLHLCGRLVEVMIYSSRNDYAATARVCEAAIAFFRTKPFESNLPLQAFYYQLIVCYLQMQEFEKGEAIMVQYQGVFEEGSFNWFKLQELFFLLAMYTRHYERAFEVLVMVQKKLSGKGAYPAHIVEMWKVYGAYVHFLIQIKQVTPSFQPDSKFKLARFLNETPVFSKDKQGMNIPILVIQILFNLAARNYSESIDRMESIEKYCSRYLRQNETYRSSCFIKALLQFPLANFHPEAVRRKSQKYIDLLKSQPLEVANQTHEIEIIPYEHLWELALQTIAV